MILEGFVYPVNLTANVNLVILLILIPLGLVLFLAPLMSTHNRMVEVKNVEMASMRKMFAEHVNYVLEPNHKDDWVMHACVLLTFEALERKAATIPTWPVESQIFGRLIAVMFSVFTITLARYVQLFLHI